MSQLWIRAAAGQIINKHRYHGAMTGHEQGPFYHGTARELRPGEDQIEPGHDSLYGSSDHAHMTTNYDSATEYADNQLAMAGKGYARVYEVHPTGDYERDPQDIKGGYRSRHPLTIRREVDRWQHDADMADLFGDDEEG